MDEELLIENVRIYPVLFDPFYKEYRNQLARKEAWNQIGEKLGLAGEVCKDAWSKLRNAYTNALRRRKTKSGQEAKNYVKWKFEDEMSFLASTLEPRETSENSTIENLVDDAEHDQNFLTENTNDIKPNAAELFAQRDSNTPASSSTSNLPSPTSPPSPTSITAVPTKKRRLDSAVSEMVAIMKENSRLRALHLSIPSDTRMVQPNDETEMFFLSLAKTVNKLSAIEHIKVKMETSQIIFAAQLRDLQQKNHPEPTSPIPGSLEAPFNCEGPARNIHQSSTTGIQDLQNSEYPENFPNTSFARPRVSKHGRKNIYKS